MKTILVPTDFSESAENAAKYALELATCYKKAKVLLFNAYIIQIPLAEAPIDPVQFSEIEIGKERMHILKEFDKELKLIHANIETELIVKQRSVTEEILHLLNTRHIDQIVMGVNSTENPYEISDSTTLSVMNASKVPVLIIPKEAKFKRPEKIALAFDHAIMIHDDVINQIRDFAKLFQAKIMIFDVLKKTEQVSSEKLESELTLENSLDDLDYSSHFPSGDNLLEEINSFVITNKADVLIMIPHNHNFLQGIFHHSKTKAMAFQTTIPLLIIYE